MMARLSNHAVMPLRDLLDGFVRGPVRANPPIAGLSLDSRRIQPDWLFLACSGGSGHGLDFAEDARAAGAVAIAAEPDGDWDEAEIAVL